MGDGCTPKKSIRKNDIPTRIGEIAISTTECKAVYAAIFHTVFYPHTVAARSHPDRPKRPCACAVFCSLCSSTRRRAAGETRTLPTGR